MELSIRELTVIQVSLEACIDDLRHTDAWDINTELIEEMSGLLVRVKDAISKL